MMTVSWFSAGCSSFAATWLMREQIDRVVYIDVANQHPDSMRFVREAEEFIGRQIEVIRSSEYASVDDVIERRRFINGPSGALCTMELKKRVRQEWERENLDQPTTYVWGYDSSEVRRAARLAETMIEFGHRFPLIDHGIDKAGAHSICEQLGIRRPEMYDLGYPNNNCIGCVKGGKGYWNKIRRDFPKVFARRAIQEREIGHSCIRGVFLDELDPDAGRCDVVVPDCSFTCGALEATQGEQ